MAGCRSSSAANAQLASRHHTAVSKSLSKRRHDDDAGMAPARGAPEVTLQEGAAPGSAMARKAAGKAPEEILLDWKREQALLKARVVDQDTEAWQLDPAFSGLQRVGGVDVSFVKDDSGSACASLVVLSYPELEVLYEDCRMVTLTAPYVSGFLAFREVSFLVDAMQRLQEREPCLMPQVLFVDGNGVLHHRGFGVACHLGVLTDLPCIGVAKKLLQVDGLENNALHKEKIQLLKAGGDSFPLMGGSGTVLGRALRSHDHSTKPLYVSVGHKISLEAAVRLTHSCCKFRIPEPVRQADIRSRDYIRRTQEVQGVPAPQSGRSKEAQRPKACPQGVSEEPAARGEHCDNAGMMS
ncbi:endonuclease V isoform X5 [Dama dama]|uniref:endonuclease V isoform X5 n=1 Tax=Dama dama TaxID=30532 RepID=UPI002A36F66D|nr:endonuclease V isoform X5 [Dama dama]